MAKVKLIKERDRDYRAIDDGKMGDVRVGRDVGADISETMTCGITSFENCSHEWTVRYDEYLYCIEGTFTIKTKEGDFTLEPGDAIWLPADTWMIYEAKEKARAVMAVYPIDWRKRRGME